MRDLTVVERLKLLAAIVLAISLLLPLYSLPGAAGERDPAYAWQLAVDDWGSGGLLALAYLWPAMLVLFGRFAGSRRWRFMVSLGGCRA